ncbi:hypothetical protein ACFWBB_25590 [Streptomyces sp. NPDC060000]|uniref:hypothetical protein n=1 Tax=Streptomyces sp. NPDC060000 TaxID=3347031 RepID=UPI0036BFBED6
MEAAELTEGEVVREFAEGEPGELAEGELTWVGLAEPGLTDAGLADAGLTDALEESPDWHPVTTRAAEATTTAVTEPRTPNLFLFVFVFVFLSLLMFPFPFPCSFPIASACLFSFSFSFSYRMLPPNPNRTAGGMAPRHRPSSSQTERAGNQVLLSTDL